MATSFKKKKDNKTIEMFITEKGIEINESYTVDVDDLTKNCANMFFIPWDKVGALLDTLEEI